MRFWRLSVVLACVLPALTFSDAAQVRLGVVSGVATPPSFDSSLDEMRARGIAYLVQKQRADGSWSSDEVSPTIVTSLVIMAISGRPGEDTSLSHANVAVLTVETLRDAGVYAGLLDRVQRARDGRPSADVTQHLAREQRTDGSWPGPSTSADDDVISTAYAVLTLQAVLSPESAAVRR